uniref:hypothetical protein n=1 Tax=Methylibium sp. TaxID=2067992 RepID=UPI0025F2B307
MRHELQRSARPQVQSLLLWVLLCLLPLQGLAGVLAQSIGAVHFHAQSLADATPMQGWQDFRRQVDGSVHGVSAAHHVHAHAHLDRHHHAGPDASAVVVDGGGSEAVQAEDAPAGASGALGQAIGPLGDAVLT